MTVRPLAITAATARAMLDRPHYLTVGDILARAASTYRPAILDIAVVRRAAEEDERQRAAITFAILEPILEKQSFPQ